MNEIKYINLENIIFNKIIFDRSAFGIIWLGKYQNKICIIKMVTLNSGIHYDKDKNCYYDKNNKILKLSQYKIYPISYDTINKIPFIHKYFIKKRSMSYSTFISEINSQKLLSEINLSPKIYDYGISHTVDNFKYGFIIMEKLDMNLKDYILINKNKLLDENLTLIKNKIKQLHDNNYYHGDLKPNNIGINIKNNIITKIQFFDCLTLKNIELLDDVNKEYYKNRDLHKFNVFLNKIIK